MSDVLIIFAAANSYYNFSLLFFKNAQKVRSDSKVHECWRDGDSSQHLLYNKCVNYFNSKKGIIERQKHLHFVDNIFFFYNFIE